jgi:hypothetical protein
MSGSVFECKMAAKAFENRTQNVSGKWPFENRTVQISDVDCTWDNHVRCLIHNAHLGEILRFFPPKF